MTRPAILVLAPTAPAATGGGLAMRAGMFVEALARVGTVDVAVAALFGAPDAAARAWLERHAARVAIIDPAGRLDSHFALLARLVDPAARAEAFTHYGRPSLTARLPAAVAAEIAAAVAGRRYDLVHVARGYLAPLALALPLTAPDGGRPRLTLDADEDDARLARRQADERRRQGDADAARLLDLEAAAHARLAAAVLPAFDRVWTSSAADRDALLRVAPGAALGVVANGVAIGPRRPGAAAGGARLLFVGALGYGPNHDGLTWFLDQVWPRLRRRADVRLDIVGAAPSEALRRLARRPGVRLHGFQPDLTPFYRRAALVVAPLRTGAGTRIKILEAAAHGVPVVATTLAAKGLPLVAGRDIWRADRPDAFAAAVLAALRHPAARARVAAAARTAVRHDHDRDRLAAGIAVDIAALFASGG